MIDILNLDEDTIYNFLSSEEVIIKCFLLLNSSDSCEILDNLYLLFGNIISEKQINVNQLKVSITNNDNIIQIIVFKNILEERFLNEKFQLTPNYLRESIIFCLDKVLLNLVHFKESQEITNVLFYFNINSI